MKTCFKCKDAKPASEFYAHGRMRDGLLGKCKACTKADVAKHRDENHDRVCACDRARFKSKERKLKIRQYRFAMKERDPAKWSARYAVSNAVRDGRIAKPIACQECGGGGRIEAHHTDYSKPLDVVWVCFKCHREKYHGQRISA